MATLVPIDHDPFIASPQGLIPVDHDPFAQSPSATKVANANKNLERYGSAIIGAADSASFGLGDELRATIGALPAYLTSKMDYGTTRDNLLEKDRQGIKDMQSRNPGAFLGGQVAGAVGTGVGLAKAFPAVANSFRGSEILGSNLGLFGRALKGGAAGAASLGTYGLASGEGIDDRLGKGQSGAITGGILGAAIPVAGAAVGGLVGKKSQPLSADEIRSMASDAYKKADETGGTLKGWFTNRFIDQVDTLRPQTEAGKILAGDDAFSKVADRLGQLKNKRLSLQEAQEIDEFLGDAVDGFTEMGRVTKQGKKLLDIQTNLRNMIDSADDTLVEGGKEGFEALKQGRQLWSAQAKMRDIEKIITRAENAQQPATAIKNGFNSLLNNPQRMRGYSAEERKLIKQAAETGVVADLIRTGGSRLIPIIAGASGGGVLGTVAAGAGSMASRNIATRNAMFKAGKVAQAISNRAAPQQTTQSLTVQQIMKMKPADARRALEQLQK